MGLLPLGKTKTLIHNYYKRLQAFTDSKRAIVEIVDVTLNTLYEQLDTEVYFAEVNQQMYLDKDLTHFVKFHALFPVFRVAYDDCLVEL